MTIERYHFNEPWQVTAEEPLEVQAANALLRFPSTHETLTEGEHPLTPSRWTRHTHEHTLIVFPEGNGLYKLTPRDSEVGSVANFGLPTGYKHGGRQIQLPEDSPIVAVSGGVPGKAYIGVYDLLLHHPGPSPRAQRRPGQQGRRGV